MTKISNLQAEIDPYLKRVEQANPGLRAELETLTKDQQERVGSIFVWHRENNWIDLKLYDKTICAFFTEWMNQSKAIDSQK